MAEITTGLPAGTPFYALREASGEIRTVNVNVPVVAELHVIVADDVVCIGVQGQSHMIVGVAYDAFEIERIIQRLRDYQMRAARSVGAAQ